MPSRKCAQSKRPYTAKNTVFSTNFLVWNFFGKAKFPHSFGRFRKLGEITVFYAVLSNKKKNQKIVIKNKINFTCSFCCAALSVCLFLFLFNLNRLPYWITFLEADNRTERSPQFSRYKFLYIFVNFTWNFTRKQFFSFWKKQRKAKNK